MRRSCAGLRGGAIGRAGQGAGQGGGGRTWRAPRRVRRELPDPASQPRVLRSKRLVLLFELPPVRPHFRDLLKVALEGSILMARHVRGDAAA